ncbi:DegQ family serine endoprotease [Pandoraea apista]|uniref:Probable periplasmic serine endoprotease DegP-like n=1 Tax=Pandoraea apista TaxID=93218 RepID=A0ABX9ZJ20_9BURK|nr:DegQ family serine endoprotease [Pandoraea apista]AJE97231.1 peptidase [Pandoraea apista]AKH71193.1 peptidase [Pandoraea apista]AKI63464.1 peptidase [Pandoraea apista]AVF41849.1 DegQ family serine endoprotease [Pandoraea apista]PTD98463.1 DegQ family serine endoprotease [Pandoraea apista]
MRTSKLTRTLVASAVLVAMTGGYVAGRQHWQAPIASEMVSDANAANPALAIPVAGAQNTPNTAPRMLVPDFSQLAEQYGPAVVNISVTHDGKPSAARGSAAIPMPPGMDQNDPLFQFFRHFYGAPGNDGGGNDDGGDGGSGPTRSLGSGFIVSPDGYILTNAHVVDDASQVTVKLTDKREYKAKVVGSDKASDVALLKIAATDLPTVKIGDPAKTKAGEWVVAIGSPYGFDNTVTAGIVSAKARALPDENYTPFIQTDVPVNPGNSGGPLFNLNGEVIGINSMIYSRTGGFQGLSFAIPIDMAMKVKSQLQQYGKVSRGRIGVAIQEVNQSLAKSFGLPKPTGALVSSIDKNGPAAKSDLKPGDVILAVNGTTIDDSVQLPEKIADMRPGQKATLTVWRNGAKQDVSVTVAALNEKKDVASNDDSATHGRLGLAVRELSPEEKRAAQVANGLLVARVGGPAEQAGVQPGDIILSLNGTPVTSASQLSDKLKKAGNNVALLVQRDGQQIFIPVDLG